MNIETYRKTKKIAVLSPIAWRTPPRHYGAWETVASNITEGLVRKGWDVTLFATADSITKGKLHSIIKKGYEEDPAVDPKVAEYTHIAEMFEHADQFDLIHSHYDFMALTYTQLITTPVLTTIHGFSSPQIVPLYHKYDKYKNVYFVSISNSDRVGELTYMETVYNGLDLALHTFFENPGKNLVFLGRIHPDKGLELAIETALKADMNLIIAGIIQDENYFAEKIKPHINNTISYIGPVNPKERNELFSQAYALLHLNTLPERFGLVLAEANASGIPVIAMDRGSCREVIAHNKTGFLVNSVNEAVEAIKKISTISRETCRQHVEENFSLEHMVQAYENVYSRIFDNTNKQGG
ncbi:glycosyltransferase family 4 protein [Candidatus Omnitrophota bacterium]